MQYLLFYIVCIRLTVYLWLDIYCNSKTWMEVDFHVLKNKKYKLISL